MANLDAQGISIHYELYVKPGNPPVLLISGLGGSGASWHSQIERFAADYYTIVPDQRGTGQSTRTEAGCSISQLAMDMAVLLEHLHTGPAHVVGSSTGGAIAQIMAVRYPQLVRSVTLSSAFARPDAYMRRQFALRRKLVADADLQTVYSCYALFLFASKYASDHPDLVEAWVQRAASQPADRGIAVKRIDMIMAHDALAQLGGIHQPSFVVCGDRDLCTPLYLSEEIASAIPEAKLAILQEGGHFIHDEQPQQYFDAVRGFIEHH